MRIQLQSKLKEESYTLLLDSSSREGSHRSSPCHVLNVAVLVPRLKVAPAYSPLMRTSCVMMPDCAWVHREATLALAFSCLNSCAVFARGCLTVVKNWSLSKQPLCYLLQFSCDNLHHLKSSLILHWQISELFATDSSRRIPAARGV